MLSNFFSTIDLFGLPVIINYCGKEKLKTHFGGICTVLFLSFLAWSIYDSSQELFLKTKPTSISSVTVSHDPREMLLTPSKFPVAIALQAPDALQYSSFVNESIFTVGLQYTSSLTTQNSDGSFNREVIQTHIPLEKCTARHFGEKASSFTNLDWDTLYCISFDQANLTNISIRGLFSSPIYNTLNFLLFECNENTSTVQCASEDVRKQYLEGAWFSLIYSNMVINPNNYSHPDSRYQDMLSKPITRTSLKMSTIYLSHVEVSTDAGALFESKSTENYVTVTTSSDDWVARNTSDNSVPLMAISLEVCKNEYGYRRSYKKIPTVLAEVGSLAKTVLMAVMIVMSPYLKLMLQETLMNQLFNINTGQKEEAHQPMQEKERNEEWIGKKRQRKSAMKQERAARSMSMKRSSQDEMMIKAISTSVNSSSLPKKASTFNENDKSERRRAYKKSGSSNETKSLNELKEFCPAKISMTESSVKLASPKSSSKGDFGNKEMKSKPQKKIAIESNQVSDRNAETDALKSPSFTGRNDLVKIEMKVLDDQDLVNRDHSILFPEKFVADKTPEHKDDEIKEEEKQLSEVIREDDIENDGEGEEGEEEEEEEEEEGGGRVGTLKQIDNKIEDIVRRSAVIRKPISGPEAIHVSVWEYLLSFIYQPKSLKQKMKVIETGSRNLTERLDVVTILQKMREIDKIRALLFDRDQLILYNNLPKPEIYAGKKVIQDMKSFRSLLTKTNVRENSGTERDIKAAYKRLKMKEDKTDIDQRILSVFHNSLE